MFLKPTHQIFMKQLILNLFICSAIFSASAVNRIRFNHLGIEDGLAQTTIRDLYQDENGAIWIGTGEDLKRYNGNNFDEVDIRLKNNKSNTIFPLVISGDKKGHLKLW